MNYIYKYSIPQNLLFVKSDFAVDCTERKNYEYLQYGC